MRTRHRYTLATISAAALLVAGCDDSSESRNEETPSDESRQQQQGVSPSEESEGSASPSDESSPESSSDDDEDAPDPGWDLTWSGDASGSISGFSVLHGHAGDGKRIRLVPEMKEGEFEMQLTLMVLDLRGRATGTFEVDRAEFAATNRNLDCQHPAPGDDETDVSIEVKAYDNSSFRGSFEGTLQCQPRSKEETDDPPRIEISGTFVDN